MRLGYDLIVLDLEINKPNKPGEKIIEIGAVKFLRDGGIHPTKFQRFIVINEPLEPEITTLTGITDEMLQLDGVPFTEAISHFHKWATAESKNILLAAWGGDVPYLIQYCRDKGVAFPFRRKSIEVKSIVIWLNAMFDRKYKSDGLGSNLDQWQVGEDESYGKKHRALADAWNTARLMQGIWEHYKENSEKVKKALAQLGVK